MGFFEALSRGLERSREALNEVFYFGGEVDEDFWEDLEDTLVMGDMGAEIAMQVTDDLRDEAARKNLKTADQLRGALAERLPEFFVSPRATSSATPRAACSSWASTAPARPPRWERSPATWRTVERRS